MIWMTALMGFLLAAFGATSAAALVAVSRLELSRALARRLRGGDGSLALLERLEDQLTAASTTTALGVLVIAASIPALLGGLGLLASAAMLVLVGVPFVLATGYFLPRWLTQPRAEAVHALVLPVLEPWRRLLHFLLPARVAGNPASLRAIFREGISSADEDPALATAGGVLSFSERPVRELLTPRTDLVAIRDDEPLEEIAQAFAHSGYSRIPVYRGSIDDIIGMLHAFDLFRLQPGDPLPVRPVAVAPPSRTCGDLLLEMQRERRHLAVIIDEFGGTLGIVTLEDLLEELVGDIFDEHDEEAAGAAATAGAPVLEANAETLVAAVEEQFAVRLPRREATTLAGRLAELLGRIPQAGERYSVAGLEIDVVEASPARAERMLVRLGPVNIVSLNERPA
jgi:CBS domain containing-hemolysin-like protein